MAPSPVAFGPFLITRRIARGGMAEIYRAKRRHAGAEAPWIAVKIMRPAGADADPMREQLFLREARIARTLQHPNVLALMEAGAAEQRVYLAMEYLRGRDLSAVGRGPDEAPFPIELALHVATEAARGLGHAHRRRDEHGEPLEIVHRDVSPGNIMVGYDGVVKVLDFGVARMREPEGLHTATGTVRGKFAFMSPEQTLGEPVDARSDVFSLGTVLYELITRAHPFRARTPLETIERVQTVRPVPPSRLRAEVPPEVDEVLARCLAKEPSRRFEDAEAFADALGSLLEASWDERRARLAEEVSLRFAAAAEAELRELREEEQALALIEVIDFAVGGADAELDAPSVAIREDEEAPSGPIEPRRRSQDPGLPVFALEETPTPVGPAPAEASDALLAALQRTAKETGRPPQPGPPAAGERRSALGIALGIGAALGAAALVVRLADPAPESPRGDPVRTATVAIVREAPVLVDARAGLRTASTSSIPPAAAVPPLPEGDAPVREPVARVVSPPAVGRHPRRGTGWLVPARGGTLEVDGTRYRATAGSPIEVPAGRHLVRWIREEGSRAYPVSLRAGARRTVSADGPIRPARGRGR